MRYEAITMVAQKYDVYFEYGDRGDGKPRYDEYKDVWSIGGGIKGALSVALIHFYDRRSDSIEITKVVIEKVNTK